MDAKKPIDRTETSATEITNAMRPHTQVIKTNGHKQ